MDQKHAGHAEVSWPRRYRAVAACIAWLPAVATICFFAPLFSELLATLERKGDGLPLLASCIQSIVVANRQFFFLPMLLLPAGIIVGNYLVELLVDRWRSQVPRIV